MTNEEQKQAAIKKAYGEDYDRLREFINCDGVFIGETGLISDELFDAWQFVGVTPRINSDRKTSGSRPRVLIGTSNNNGWTRIEPDGSNLPVEGGYYKIGMFLDEKWNEGSEHIHYEVKRLFNTGFCTHYRPVTELPKPIY